MSGGQNHLRTHRRARPHAARPGTPFGVVLYAGGPDNPLSLGCTASGREHCACDKYGFVFWIGDLATNTTRGSKPTWSYATGAGLEITPGLTAFGLICLLLVPLYKGRNAGRMDVRRRLLYFHLDRGRARILILLCGKGMTRDCTAAFLLLIINFACQHPTS